jgi:hypothetical protein
VSETVAEYAVDVRDVAVRPCRLVSPEDAERLRRCQAVPVCGDDGRVDVRMPREVWARVRGEGQ